ncbi:bifunctional adenosylcobinamide kinase/adenosylcobinamide-phosphate guanylyltransferase [Halomonas halodenitrificans]|uniref:bifunctional adenosylcobinamide kinase/adenosylcobinamide-phosphate guanylyltransferase n=1 Tax=Halomonas halodenitrificans TaxID=28252 RepID=UPI0005BE6DBE|nr:bifunctional adenosylcobinamide kinase/adenosylcobinamide-phosphate guanylyltransferase [Halomonas halodenitrificans]
MIAFVGGGARSGKSHHAEALAGAWHRSRGGELVYLATARAADAEMAARIARHRRERDSGWRTLEAPLALDAALAEVAEGDSVLLDCLTLWASQWLYAGGGREADGEAMLGRVVEMARTRDIALVVVSNDLNEEPPPTDAETWRYLAFLQRLHRRLAREADRVIEVVAGMAIDWKNADGVPAGEGDTEALR